MELSQETQRQIRAGARKLITAGCQNIRQDLMIEMAVFWAVEAILAANQNPNLARANVARFAERVEWVIEHIEKEGLS